MPANLRTNGLSTSAACSDGVKYAPDGEIAEPHQGARSIWHSNDDLGFEAMVLDESMQAGVRFVWTDPKRQDEFRLEFFCFGMRQIPGGTEACTDLADVSITADDETGKAWRIRFAPTLNAGLSTRKVKDTTGTWTPIAAFHMPFELTVRMAVAP